VLTFVLLSSGALHTPAHTHSLVIRCTLHTCTVHTLSLCVAGQCFYALPFTVVVVTAAAADGDDDDDDDDANADADVCM